MARKTYQYGESLLNVSVTDKNRHAPYAVCTLDEGEIDLVVFHKWSSNAEDARRRCAESNPDVVYVIATKKL